MLALKGPRYPAEFKAQVVAAVQDRMSLRGVRRTFGVCYATAMRWLGKKIQALPAGQDTLLPGEKGDVLELDELFLIEAEKKGASSLRGLVNALEGEARSAGASQLSIVGTSIINKGFLSPGIANRLGFVFREINSETVQLSKEL